MKAQHTKDYEAWMEALNLPPVGTEVEWAGQTFELVGYKPRGKKYKFIGKAKDGKLYKLPHRAIMSYEESMVDFRRDIKDVFV